MAVLALTSVTGSPGVTTSALGLTLSWPRSVLLVDADPTPAQAIESGYLGTRPVRGAGLLDVAHTSRQHGDVQRALWEGSVELEPAPSHGSEEAQRITRRYLPGFSHPGGAGVVGAHWAEIAACLADLENSGVDVIIDLGRWQTGPARGLAEHLDQVLIVTRSSLRSLAALRLSLPSICDQLEQRAPQCEVGLGVIGPGRPYSPSEVGQHFGLACSLTLPWQPEAAAVHSDGEPPPRRFGSSPLVQAQRVEAGRLAQRLGRRSRILARELATTWR